MRVRAGLAIATLWACSSGPAPQPGAWTADELAQLERMARVTEPRPDPTNRWYDDPRAARLGQALFYDEGLSPTATVSCASCHQPDLHFTDGLALASGIGTAARHTPTIEGTQWGAWFFWDGRADSLWSQALGPLENPDEMGGDRVHVVRHVLEDYAGPYTEIFGPPPELGALPARGRPDRAHPEGELARSWSGLTDTQREGVDLVFANVGKALAAYERLLVPGASDLDRYVRAVLSGDPAGGRHLDDQEIEGLSLFLRDGACVSCHHGPMLTDRAFHNLGLPEATGYDPGRQTGARLVKSSPFSCTGPWSDAEDCPELRYLDPNFPDFQAAFKTPSLRNVAATAPYMHNGRFPTLESVLAFYSDLPGVPAAGHRELTLEPLRLTDAEMSSLLAFLRALDGGPVPEALARPPE